MDLGDGCVNLERLCLGDSERSRFVSTPGSGAADFQWAEYERENKCHFESTVQRLLERNPNLQVVKWVPVHENIADALGNQVRLNELWAVGKFDGRILQSCHRMLRILRVHAEPADMVMIDAPTQIDYVLEEIHFSNIWSMGLFLET
ncbi:hypothetical protein BGX26_005019, partial [Mortierella sp. AD094]